MAPLHEALQMHSSGKFAKIRTLRDQIEAFTTLRIPGDNLLAKESSFRASTAKTTELNSTCSDSLRKYREESQKKKISPYYDQKIRAIKKFQRSRIPKTACDGKISENYRSAL